jgi:hypothetical protein
MVQMKMQELSIWHRLMQKLILQIQLLVLSQLILITLVNQFLAKQKSGASRFSIK